MIFCHNCSCRPCICCDINNINSCDFLKKSLCCLEKNHEIFNDIFKLECKFLSLIICSICNNNFCVILDIIKLYIADIINLYQIIESYVDNKCIIDNFCECITRFNSSKNEPINIIVTDKKCDYINNLKCISKYRDICKLLEHINKCIIITKGKFCLICSFIKYLKNIGKYCDSCHK